MATQLKTLYVDSSALLALYLGEPTARSVRRELEAGDNLVSHEITYTEMRTLLDRATRGQRLSAKERYRLLDAFERDWATLGVVASNPTLARRARTLSNTWPLRRYDDIHLAAADCLARSVPEDSFALLTCDPPLQHAAEAFGLPVRAPH